MVLAHGFGAVKEGGPIRSAERFAAEGYAGLAFDYRYFGESGGEPRQLLSVKRQLEDWRAAIAYARTLDGVDPDRIGAVGLLVLGRARHRPRRGGPLDQGGHLAVAAHRRDQDARQRWGPRESRG